MICPKCNHQRTAADDPSIPDYQCPACGVIYAKVGKKVDAVQQISENIYKSKESRQQRALNEDVDVLQEQSGFVIKESLIKIAGVVGVTVALVVGGYFVYGAYQHNVEAQEKAKHDAEVTARKNEVDEAKKELARLAALWANGTELASSTARIALSGPVASLQKLHMEIMDLKTLRCLDDAKKYLAETVDYSVKSYLSFMTKGYDAEIHMLCAKHKINSYLNILNNPGTCKPYIEQGKPENAVSFELETCSGLYN